MQTDAKKRTLRQRYETQPRHVRWPLLAVIAMLHFGVLYLVAQAFAPKTVQSVEREVIAAFAVPATNPEPSPPESRAKPDEGAQGNAGEEAVAAEVSAPSARLSVSEPSPLPPTSSIGEAPTSGAREKGEGTGAAGEGMGTGSGNSGRGRGGIAVTRPVHISGAINNARDYPTPVEGRNARRGTEVIVRVIVGVDGRASECSIYRASSDPEADRTTCRLVVERLGFRPAQDANGNLVAAPFYWRQRWF